MKRLVKTVDDFKKVYSNGDLRLQLLNGLRFRDLRFSEWNSSVNSDRIPREWHRTQMQVHFQGAG